MNKIIIFIIMTCCLGNLGLSKENMSADSLMNAGIYIYAGFNKEDHLNDLVKNIDILLKKIEAAESDEKLEKIHTQVIQCFSNYIDKQYGDYLLYNDIGIDMLHRLSDIDKGAYNPGIFYCTKEELFRITNDFKCSIIKKFNILRNDIIKLSSNGNSMIDEKMKKLDVNLFDFDSVKKYINSNEPFDDKKTKDKYERFISAYEGDRESIKFLINNQQDSFYSLAIAILLERNRLSIQSGDDIGRLFVSKMDNNNAILHFLEVSQKQGNQLATKMIEQKLFGRETDSVLWQRVKQFKSYNQQP